MCDYICQVAAADSTCNGISWQRAGAQAMKFVLTVRGLVFLIGRLLAKKKVNPLQWKQTKTKKNKKH